MSKKISLAKLMQMADETKLKKQGNPENKIPQKYLINGYEALPELSASFYLANKCAKMLINNKFFSKISSNYYEPDIIDAFIKYAKSEETLFNIRKKHCILELNQQKISNFLIVKFGIFDNCIDGIVYAGYLVTTIGDGPGAIITIPQDEPEHAKAIEDILIKKNMLESFQSYSDNFNKIYDFTVEFIQYVNRQNTESFRNFIPKEYKISENEAYQKYLKEKTKQEEKDASEKKFAEDDAPPEESEPIPNIVSYEETRFSTDVLPNYNYELDVYSDLNKFLSLADTKIMVTLFGFFINNAVSRLSENKYHYSLGLIIPEKNFGNAKKIVDLLYRIVFKIEKSKDILYDPTRKIKDYHNASIDYLTTISTISDFNKTDRQNFSAAMSEYYENKPNRLKNALLILSSKAISCEYIHNIELNTIEISELEANKSIVDLKSSAALQKTIKAFLDNIKHIYTDKTIPLYDYNSLEVNNATLINKEINEREHDLSSNSALPSGDAVIYAPIIYFIEKYFQFLLDSNGITEEQHISLSNKLRGLYASDLIEENNDSENICQLTTEEISETLLKCILEAYKSDEFVKDSSNDNAYLYTGGKEYNELICFQHTQESPMKYIIDFLEGIGIPEEISNIKDIVLKQSVGEELKKLWKDSGISHSKNGLLYTTRKGKVIAIICDKLKGRFES